MKRLALVVPVEHKNPPVAVLRYIFNAPVLRIHCPFQLVRAYLTHATCLVCRETLVHAYHLSSFPSDSASSNSAAEPLNSGS